MSPEAATRLEFRVVTRFVPTTFLERGVAIPFTNPHLAGARARPGERSTLEVIAPNPSGGRGVYILPWANISGLCNPTLHDRRLIKAVSELRGVTPDAIRHAAREVACQGLAGRGVQEAARRANDSETRACLQANFDLLLELVRQVEVVGENPIPPEKDRPVALEWRAKRAVARIAPRLQASTEQVVARLEAVASCFGSIGIGQDARIPSAIARLIRMRRAVADFAERRPDDSPAEVSLIIGTADLTIAMAKATLSDAQELPSNIAALLRRWDDDPDSVSRLLARPDWLLDGWDHICTLWELAPDLAATIAEMALLVPVIPREADEWLRDHRGRPTDILYHGRRLVRELEDWRSGITVPDLVARNERLLEKMLW